MTQAILILLSLLAAFLTGDAWLGYEPIYQTAYGALTMMAAMISLTFLWLWARRATPLALGMSFSWAGASSVLGWWWIYRLLEAPAAMVDSAALFVFLALYFCGAVLHFAVIGRSFGAPRLTFLLPILGAVGVSVLIQLIL